MGLKFPHEEIRAMWQEFLDTHKTRELLDISDLYPDIRSLNIDFSEIEDYYGDFAFDILDNPDEYLSIGEEVIKQEIGDMSKDIHLRIYNLPYTDERKVNDINSKDVGKMVSIDATVRKVTDPRPIVTRAAWKCSDCGGISYVPTEEGSLVKPNSCQVCGKPRSKVQFKFIADNSEKVDYREIEVQDNPENLSGAQQPRRLSIHITDDLVPIDINPGDRVVVVGIIRMSPTGPKNRPSALMHMYMDAIHIEKKSKDWSTIEISEKDIAEIKKLSKMPGLMDKFRQSIAPSIWGHNIIKEALVLQMFGGVPKKIRDVRKRGDIHILLVGDPGTAKSEILMQIASIAPRAIYTSGKGTSAAGLTAAAVKDKDNLWTLEAGALVLADKGMACIDEIDKMSNEDRGAIHTAMEQQVVAIDKAGIHVMLPSRCTILAAANPVQGRFDRNYSLSSQIDLDPPLLTRFDAIFKIVDVPNTSKDNALAKHIIDMHHAGENDTDVVEDGKLAPPIDTELLRKYIVYAKRIKPKMTKEVKEYLQKVYVDMRSQYNETEVIAITARQLEAMIRFAEASARMRLSEQVEIEDAERAVKIVQYYLKDVASNDDEGIVNIDYLYGPSKEARNAADEIYEYIDDYGTLTYKQILRKFSTKYRETIISQAIEMLLAERKIKKRGINYLAN